MIGGAKKLPLVSVTYSHNKFEISWTIPSFGENALMLAQI